MCHPAGAAHGGDPPARFPRARSARAPRPVAATVSWYADDVVVMTWDPAFIYEPRGDSDVMDVLDVANAQLLEMRYYDQLLDAELPNMCDLAQAMQRARPLLSSRRFADLARRFHTLVAEVTEPREKVDNAFQVTEDVYVARIYTAAHELFRVASVNAAADRKLRSVATPTPCCTTKPRPRGRP